MALFRNWLYKKGLEKLEKNLEEDFEKQKFKNEYEKLKQKLKYYDTLRQKSEYEFFDIYASVFLNILAYLKYFLVFILFALIFEYNHGWVIGIVIAVLWRAIDALQIQGKGYYLDIYTSREKLRCMEELINEIEKRNKNKTNILKEKLAEYEKRFGKIE
ncbi:hypothetical protein L8X52_06895 [Campylobacter lari]|nr:hypothetical protein [Campylobacter lari]MCV3501349.1 hypothetical protein [Campylobacter lari]